MFVDKILIDSYPKKLYASGMGYRVQIGKIQITCDLVEEALNLARRVNGKAFSMKQLPRIKDDDQGDISALWDLLKEPQKKILTALAEHSDGRTDKQLIQVVEAKNAKALGGMIAGIGKNAKRVSLDKKVIYQKIYKGNLKLYKLMPQFRTELKKILME